VCKKNRMRFRFERSLLCCGVTDRIAMLHSIPVLLYLLSVELFKDLRSFKPITAHGFIIYKYSLYMAFSSKLCYMGTA